MDALETKLIPFGTREQLVEIDMIQIPATDLLPPQPWKRTQSQRQFDHADVHA